MPLRVAVLGAGTMGAGIAQVALQHGHAVDLYDVTAAVHERGRASIEAGLAKLVEKGRLAASARDEALARLRCTCVLNDLTDVDLAIEAAPERMDIKQDLFRFLDEFCRPDAVLATNTSSLSITAIAAMTRRPERVVGLHFFNPAPLMALVEVIAGQQTGEAALAVAREFARSVGKTPVMCQDTPGFIVNRVARPFYGEALKILGEGGAAVPAIDAAMKAGGFRMGPFELMDLIGIDVNFAVTQSVYQAFFGEPRFRPHPIQQRMVAAGRLGRKSGQGFYAYGEGAPGAVQDVPVLPVQPAVGRLALVGTPPHLATWSRKATEAGWDVVVVDATNGLFEPSLLPVLSEVAGVLELGGLPAERRQAMQRTLAMHLPPGAWLVTTDLTRTATAATADHGLPTAVVGDWAGEGGTLEVALADGLAPGAPEALLGALGALGVRGVRVADHVGLVFARVISMLANEASFALQEGIASAEDIDQALKLGANYPRGPLAWADAIGLARVVALLDAVHHETAEERYRVAPLLRRRALAGLPLVPSANEPATV